MLKQKLEELGISSYDKTLFGRLLLPSWISGLLCVVISLGVVVWVFVSAHFSGSLLEQQVNAWRALNSDSDLSYYGGSDGFTLDSVFTDVMTFVLWGLLGVVLYLTITGLASAIRSAREFDRELGFVNNQRSRLIKITVFHLVVRGVVLASWLAFFKFFFGTVVFYCLFWLYTATYSLTLNDIAGVTLAFIVMSTALHVHVVFMRLLALRPRLFGS